MHPDDIYRLRPNYAGFNYELWLRRGHKGSMDDYLEWLRAGTFGVLDPADRGAVGDGVHDDSDAILDCIELAGEGGVIRLAANKTYLVTKTLTLLGGQTFDGNGATLLWKGEPTFGSDGKISSAPRIFDVKGSLGDEIKITEKVRCVGNAGSGSYGHQNAQGYTFVVIGADTDPELVPKAGDRIIVQAARNALAPESGEYWTGTSTGLTTSGAWWAEPLIVNDVRKRTSGDLAYVIRCVGTVTYPYYLPEPETDAENPENSIDISHALTYAYLQNASSKYIRRGFYCFYENPLYREYSTVRKANFLKDVTIKNLLVSAEGVAHSGDTSSETKDWKISTTANSIRFSLCENATMENVRMSLKDAGRGFVLANCWNSRFRNCVYDADYPLYGVAETHALTNAFTFASTWNCEADGCTSIRAGQSFDTSYAGSQNRDPITDGSTQEIRCPPIYTTVRGCTVIESMDSAATNHSGGWHESFVNCRFIGCGRPLAVRSPNTRIQGCVFGGQAGIAGKTEDPDGENYTTSHDNFHVQFAEPTMRGSTVEGCSFYGSKGVQITPYNDRAFNWVKGNYYTARTENGLPVHFGSADELLAYYGTEAAIKLAYDVAEGANWRNAISFPHVQVTETSRTGYLTPPDRKSLGISIRNNVFAGAQMALTTAVGVYWTRDKTGVLTDYAKGDLGVEFSDNTLVDCGKDTFPISISSAYCNGIRIDRNRFAHCISQTEKALKYLINIKDNNVRVAINDNTVEESGNYEYLYNRLGAVDADLDTNGNTLWMCSGNRILTNAPDYPAMLVTSTGTDRELAFLNSQKGTAERLYTSLTVGEESASGWQYDVDDGDIKAVVYGMPRVTIDTGAVYGAEETGLAKAACLLRTWCNVAAPTALDAPFAATKVQWRTALYHQPETVAVYDENGQYLEDRSYAMNESTYARLAACWQAGEDETETACGFATAVKLVDVVEHEDEGGQIVSITEIVEFPAPINKAMSYLAVGDEYVGNSARNVIYTKDTGKGIVIINTTHDEPGDQKPGTSDKGYKNVLAFEDLPSGFTVNADDMFALFCEVRENTRKDAIRADSSTTVKTTKSLFNFNRATPSRTTNKCADDETGEVSSWTFVYSPVNPTDLGTADVPWKMLYTDGIELPSSTPDSAKKFRITVDDDGVIAATEVT